MLKLVIFCSLACAMMCALTCEPGEFAVSYKTVNTTSTLDTEVCYGCPANCAACTSLTECTLCVDGYYVQKKQCVSNKTMSDSGCAASESNTTCDTCLSGYFLNKSKLCVKKTLTEKCLEWTQEVDTETCKTPKEGYSLIGGTLTACETGCAACSAAATCTTCKSGYYLKEDNKCAAVQGVCGTWAKKTVETCETCPSTDFYPQGNFCYGKTCKCATIGKGPYPACNETCSINCAECLSSTVCTVCNTQYYLKADNTCAACDASCATCTGPAATECASCAAGKVLYQKQCKTIANCKATTDGTACSECLDKYYKDANNVCHACADHCQTCSATACTAAVDGYYLNSGTPTECSTGVADCNKCSDATTCTGCVDGKYFSGTTCTACATNCQKCSGSQGKCTECASGYYLDNGETTNPKCVSCADHAKYKAICTAGQYMKEFWTCTALTGNCATNEPTPHSGETAQTCESCKSGYYLTDAKACTACVSNCVQCTKDLCLDCKVKFALNYDLKSCVGCPDNCDRCSNSTTCLACSTGYSLNSDNTCATSSTSNNDNNNANTDTGAFTVFFQLYYLLFLQLSLTSLLLLILLFLW